MGINNLIEEFTGEEDKVVANLKEFIAELLEMGIYTGVGEKKEKIINTSVQKDQKLEKRPSILNKLKESKEKMDKKDVVSKNDVELKN